MLILVATACSGHSSGNAKSCDGSACAADGGRRDARHDATDAAGPRPGGPHPAAQLDPTPYNLATASAFLYSGPNPVQTGVKPGTINLTQVSVVRGQVSVRSDGPGATNGLAPVAGITVTVVGHPEFGQTTTQSDGWFSMAVNGGGQITVDLKGSGYLEVQRHVTTRWLEYAITQPAVLIAPEPGTSVKLSASSAAFQVVRGLTHGTAHSTTPSEDANIEVTEVSAGSLLKTMNSIDEANGTVPNTSGILTQFFRATPAPIERGLSRTI
jgi:hypothetical protein